MTNVDIMRLRRRPKAELHLHLEGSLTPELLWTLSQRHGFPFNLRTLEDCRALYRFRDFSGFIQAIKTASQHLIEPEDYAAAVAALAAYLRAEGVVYSEAFISIGILLWRKAPVEPFWEAIESARRAAEVNHGVHLRWIFDAVRQFGAEPFERVVDWAIKLQPSGSVLAVGVGGDETQVRTADFAAGYARARAAGLRTTIHAGECRGADSVWEALELLQAERIGHGLRAFEDERLIETLAQRGTILDICPISNLRTGVWPQNQPHPAQSYYNSGIRISISSDDPGIFGCSLLDQYDYLSRNGFSPQELLQLSDQSWDCSFLPVAERRALARLPFPAPAEAGGDRRMGV